MDFFPLLDPLVGFCGLGSNPVQGISNIYWRILYVGLRAKFIFEVRIVAQDFSKLTPTDRNNLITNVSDFLQTRLSLLIRVHKIFFGAADGLMSIGHILTPKPKTLKILKDFLRLRKLPVYFNI